MNDKTNPNDQIPNPKELPTSKSQWDCGHGDPAHTRHDDGEPHVGEEAVMRRSARMAPFVICLALAVISWYFAGVFATYEFVVGESKHFGAWALVSQALTVVFALGAIYFIRKREKPGL